MSVGHPPPDRCATESGVTLWLLNTADWCEAHDMVFTAGVLRAYTDRFLSMEQSRARVGRKPKARPPTPAA